MTQTHMVAYTTASLISGLAIAAAAAPANALMATELDLRNMAARVVIVPDSGRSDIDLKVAYGSSSVPKIMVRTSGDSLIADGGLKAKAIRCVNGKDGDITFGGMGGATVPVKDLPVIYVKMPADVVISSNGGVYGEMGTAQRLELSVSGCGTWHVGHVAETVDISIGGSGDVTIGDARSASIAIGGSGTVRTGNITKLEAAIGGNGDITVLRLNGPGEVAIAGSGDVKIVDGASPKLELNIAGSGKLHYGGTVKDVDISIVGSGNVYLKKVTGNIQRSVMGSGNISLGN
ncbi:DUF2807 domain-containing protein [Asticcacaulis sp. ZE23SCel15]|uniref:GIN domain-containing protein n=1 Tax=Asticcacaulis sp. ZE23SCel15 TaxID=3059027 RepID=UPI00265FB87F|nr:DUF2807 domain-containing protein [Asticcacaulis sp. ZE23SCel15]WKL56669.1 DUF2807 domain-containing protein [Asticcacaulis sp. ZE23SCel15]